MAVTNCTISAASVGFGTYATGQSNPDYGTGSVTVNCTITGVYSIELSGGSNQVTYPERRLANGASYISYSLYWDSSYVHTWGMYPDYVMSSGNGLDQTYTVYGKIPAAQTFSVFGAYSDSVTATVTF